MNPSAGPQVAHPKSTHHFRSRFNSNARARRRAGRGERGKSLRLNDRLAARRDRLDPPAALGT